MYYVYMLRCMDNSIYTGITTDIERRMQEHFSKDKKCAKYTSRHTAKKLECVWRTENRVLASKLEYHIKTLNKRQKEALIVENNLGLILKEKIDVDMYVLEEDIKIEERGI
ncbi:MAG: GIY-YIG nuclease family protein [Clostridia bacterium]|nr:GIY-YIG nuclease family protein [Clostridia bacterium]